MDIAISKWVVDTFNSNKVFAQIANIFSWLGSKWVIIAFLLLLLFFKKTRKMSAITIVAVLFTYLLNDFVLKLIVQRERPFQYDPYFASLMDLIGYNHPTGSSMPSGHAAVAMACAVSLFCHSKKFGAPALVWAVFVGLSRVCLCAHYFSDVMVGFVVGALIAILIYYISKCIIKKYTLKKLKGRRKT